MADFLFWIVLMKRLVISFCRWLFSRHVSQLWKSWNRIILVCSFILLVINAVIFYKPCRSMLYFCDPISMGKQKHGYVTKFPDHHFGSEPFIKDADHIVDSLMPLYVHVPLTVHFVWCNQQNFQFQNYLSVLSAYKFLYPMEMIFHYSSEPELDNVGYYQFYHDLLRDVPVFFAKPLEDTGCCSNNPDDKFTCIASLLNKYGGIYIDANTLLSQNLKDLRKKPFSYFQEKSLNNEETWNVLLMLMMKNHQKSSDFSRESLSSKSPPSSCSLSSSYSMSNKLSICVHVNQELFPVNIFDLQTDFGQLARWIGYGSKSVLTPQPHETPVIPNIVHYVWLGNHTFNYFSYLSLLSTLYVFKADAVYIHGDQYPRGKYWDIIKDYNKVNFVFREVPSTVYGDVIGAHLSHASDYIRVDVLLRYGGIYMDWDTVWVNPIPESIRKYDFVACADWPRTGSYPDVFNMGVIAASKNSVFLTYFLESFRHYIDSHWSYNAIHIPYKVYEKHPNQLFHYRHLQVICYLLKCHPVWLNGYKDEDNNHLTTSAFNWRNETLVVHWTHPDPPEFDSQETLLSAKGMFSDIGKFVLEKAGML